MAATRSPSASPLPFRLLPVCRARADAQCLPALTRSSSWRQPGALSLPTVPESALRAACGPLQLHAVTAADRAAVSNRSFWSSWLTWDGATGDREARTSRCISRLKAWRPRVCEARGVWVAGAAQVLFNETGYYGPAKRVAGTLQPSGVRSVQASREHVVLTRNEYGAGFYHLLYDTLASLAFLWPRVEAEPAAAAVLNPCVTGRDHATSRRNRTVAPDFRAHDWAQPACAARPYVRELLEALGIAAWRVQPWPYTRQQRGPALGARRATFMCAHPFHATYHRGFWYVRQLRAWLHGALRLPRRDAPRAPHAAAAAAAAGEGRLLLLVDRNRCGARPTSGSGCDGGRGVGAHAAILAALRAALPRDRVREFAGDEPVRKQAALFHAAALVAGPHGAAFANAIFCRAGATLVEFHRQRWAREPNSPLYAQLARLLALRHWVVVDHGAPAERRLGHGLGYQLSPQAVVATARAALDQALDAAPRAAAGERPPAALVELPNFIPEASHVGAASRAGGIR